MFQRVVDIWAVIALAGVAAVAIVGLVMWSRGSDLILKNGIRYSGMPAFWKPEESDEHLWKIVAYVRHLSKLTLPNCGRFDNSRKSPLIKTRLSPTLRTEIDCV